MSKDILIVGTGRNQTLLPTELRNRADSLLGKDFTENFINSQIENDIPINNSELIEFAEEYHDKDSSK